MLNKITDMFTESAKAKLRSKFIVMVSRTTLDESFVQLRLQDSKEESLPDVLTYRDVEYLERCRQSAQEVKLEQLFSKLKNDDIVPKKVLIKGRAGVGKTTLIDFMLREWATRHSWPQFDYIFVIKLREVSERQWRIGDLLFLGLNLSSKEKKAVLDEIREHSNRTLVIVDSLDEFPLFLYSQSQFPFGTEVNLSEMISIIINCTWLPDSTVVVTSRHTDQIPSKVFCRIVDVYGFTMGGIETYVNNFCKENKQLRKFIWKNITTNPNMATFCHTPVQCVFMCNSLKDQFQHSESGSIPDMTTMTQLYVKATYRLAKKLHPRLKPDKGQANLKHVFRILKAPFTKHAQLAKYGMENQLRVIFSDDDLEQHRFSNDDKLTGFLSGTTKTDPDDIQEKVNTWSFSHLSLQEFFMSLGLLLQSPRTNLPMLLQKGNMVKQYEIVITFLAGLLGDQKNAYYLNYMGLSDVSYSCKEFIESLKCNLGKDPLKLVCFIYETQCKDLVCIVPEEIKTSKIHPMEMLSLHWILVSEKCPIISLE